MARYGINPARNTDSSYQPSRVTAAMMTYIPSLEGYFQHRLDVMKLSLASLIASLPDRTDVMVLNNGSCSEVSQFLENELKAERVDYVIHSRRNLGVIGGLKVLFHAVQGEIIAYGDDDVFYYPGWLEAQLRILEVFPKVGMVSGAPVGFSSEHATTTADSLIHSNPAGLEVFELPRNPDWEASWAISTGRQPQKHLEDIQSSPHQAFRFEGVEAVRSAKHFQFLTPKDVILKAFSQDWSGSLMDDMVALDESVDRLGYLRLSTVERCSRHIGNSISDQVRLEADQLGLSMEGQAHQIEEHEHWLLKIPGSGRILWPLYRWLFKVLHKVR